MSVPTRNTGWVRYGSVATSILDIPLCIDTSDAIVEYRASYIRILHILSCGWTPHRFSEGNGIIRRHDGAATNADDIDVPTYCSDLQGASDDVTLITQHDRTRQPYRTRPKNPIMCSALHRDCAFRGTHLGLVPSTSTSTKWQRVA